MSCLGMRVWKPYNRKTPCAHVTQGDYWKGLSMQDKTQDNVPVQISLFGDEMPLASNDASQASATPAARAAELNEQLSRAAYQY